jgi:signal transduction histidine kinase
VRRLGIWILIFCLGLTAPLGYLVYRTFHGLAQEEVAELRFFADELFDQIETDLAEMIRLEEARPIDDRRYAPEETNTSKESNETPEPTAPYIIGYFQNNPDGSLQSLEFKPDIKAKGGPQPQTDQLEAANRIFNQKKTNAPTPPAPVMKDKLPEKKEQNLKETFSQRYLAQKDSKKQKIHLGREKSRVEQIPAEKAASVAQSEYRQRSFEEAEDEVRLDKEGWRGEQEPKAAERDIAPAPEVLASGTFPVEIDPIQSVFITSDQVYLFRRIVLGNQVYRQGVLVDLNALMQYLAEEHFRNQPMAQFTGLHLAAWDQGREVTSIDTGVSSVKERLALNRVFPRPFGFLQARLTCDSVPQSPERTTFTAMTVVLAIVILAGLFAIYQSARRVTDLSERRAGFVSSVTHELKTPLTNIRMYIEMLQAGIASDPDREEEYLKILSSESARLSRLINNVLEFSKLEKKQRQLNPRPGDLKDVLDEVRTVMGEKIRQEGFTLSVDYSLAEEFPYDREVMIQVLINLIENSLKFGKDEPRKEIAISVAPAGEYVHVSVSDTGPGIPKESLGKVFHDFYRVDDSLTRRTRGTGIGLALVRKFVTAMGGKVEASCNAGPGCTISLFLPVKK